MLHTGPGPTLDACVTAYSRRTAARRARIASCRAHWFFMRSIISMALRMTSVSEASSLSPEPSFWPSGT
eukprot:scaffold72834_cov48-Phaeocystis_antarctica.AAC.2